MKLLLKTDEGKILFLKPSMLEAHYSDEKDGRHYWCELTCEITKRQYENFLPHDKNG